MPKKYVIQKKQVKRYFKRNKQWLLGIAAIVVVFFVGLMYASANGHLVALSGMLKGKVAGETSMPIMPMGMYSTVKVAAATSPGSSVSAKFGTAEEKNCNLGCSQNVAVDTVVTFKTINDNETSRPFEGWVAGNAPYGYNTNAVCPCSGNKECKFSVSAHEDVQDANGMNGEATISCFAKYTDGFKVHVLNFSRDHGHIERAFGKIVGSGLSCSAGTESIINTGICSLVKSATEKTVSFTATPAAGFEFAEWFLGSAPRGTCPCNTDAKKKNPTCTVDTSVSKKDIDCVASYANTTKVDVTIEVDDELKRGTVSAIFGSANPQSCTADKSCTAYELIGTKVGLTAVPGMNQKFLGWGHGIGVCPCAENNPSCGFAMAKQEGLLGQHKCIAYFTETKGTPTPTANPVNTPFPTPMINPNPTNTPTPFPTPLTRP